MWKPCILILTLAVSAFGQSSADLNAKFPHVTAYKVRPDVLMTARFAADGQVCKMTLEKRQAIDDRIVFGGTFSEQEVQSLVTALLPENERGRNLTKMLNASIDGDFITTEYTYENAIVRVHGVTRPAGGAGNRVIIITWPKRTCVNE